MNQCRKTDSRDARKLARLFAGGLLEPIHVPSRELEAARDLVRAREDARLDRMRDRHRLSKFCLRHGRTLPTNSWTIVRRKWLSEQRFEFAAQQQTFDTYVHAVDLVDARIDQLERAIRETAEQGPWCQLVARLRCLRGIDTLTALALAAEISDFDRFKTAEEFMAFVGLVPSERSSGEQRRQEEEVAAQDAAQPPAARTGGRGGYGSHGPGSPVLALLRLVDVGEHLVDRPVLDDDRLHALDQRVLGRGGARRRHR